MDWKLWSLAVLLIASLSGVPTTRLGAENCNETPSIAQTPPADPNADPFGAGPWFINADRTMWVTALRWSAGKSHKTLWIRPAGQTLTIEGQRIDGVSRPLVADIPCCYPTGFQATALTFPTAGCWQVSAKAGESALSFVTSIR
jgi:hypothetical protein